MERCGRDEENITAKCNCTTQGYHKFRYNEMSRIRRLSTTASNNTRIGTALLWRNIVAVILLTIMIENNIYESERRANAGKAQSPSVSAEKYPNGSPNYIVDENSVRAESHDDDMYYNLDLDLDIVERRNNDESYPGRNEFGGENYEGRENDESHELLKIKRGFDTKVAEPASNELERYYDDSQDIIVLATVDGTFYGVSRSTGQTIWKRRDIDQKKNNSSSGASESTAGDNGHRNQLNTLNGSRQHQTIEEHDSIIFAPLTSTSTTKEPDAGGKASRTGKTRAIPSVDGRVFLGPGRIEGDADGPLQGNEEEQPVNDFFTSSSSNVVRDLVSRTPFVDSQGKIFIGSSHSSAAALDRDTGEILSFIKVEGKDSSADDNSAPFRSERGEKQKNTIWVGRVDYSVSVFSSSGDADVEFSTSEVLGMEDMINYEDSYQQTIYNPALMIPSPVILATPRGKLAMRDSNSDKILWVADETFDTPVAFALESRYGKSLKVDFIADAPVHRRFSKEYLNEQGGADFDNNKMFNTESVYWTPTDRELFAVPIGRRQDYNRLPELPYVPIDLENDSKAISRLVDRQCNPDSPFYEACLNESFNHLGVDLTNSFHVFIMSWIAPTVAFAFVLAFEMGRRYRVSKDPGVSRSLSMRTRKKSDQRQDAIQVSDEVLGYGGHGTIVYRGELDGRHVAVKRMLKAYHASAEREISLLIESDGHPHVVRYFLKEDRDDFVYLALELCEMTLEDLIAALRQKILGISLEEAGKSNSVLQIDGTSRPMKQVLFEVALGVKHIHSLRIVHRDLKPQNILLAKKARTSIKFNDNDSLFCAFQDGKFSPKISDMGLGKQLNGHSSFGFSTFNNSFKFGDAGLEDSLIRARPGPGTVGWQAPEVMIHRPAQELSAALSNNGSAISMVEASPIESSLSDRTSRSVDIFSLGCIFHYSLLPGSHPFGEWYERESNIIKNSPSVESLKDLPDDASDLIRQMIDRKPSARPNASQICTHPFFWSETKRLSFLCDLSDRIEHDATSTNDKIKSQQSTHLDALLIEQEAVKIVGTAWGTRLDQGFFSTVTKFRMYDQSSVRDLLRLIRNKHHHFDELASEFRKLVSTQEDLLSYFESKFPHLLMHCYSICCLCLRKDDQLVLKYDMNTKFQPKNDQMLQGKDNVMSHSSEQQPEFKNLTSRSCRDHSNKGLSKPSNLSDDALSLHKFGRKGVSDCKMGDGELNKSTESENVVRTVACGEEDASFRAKQNFCQSSVIAWEGSTTSSTLGCRGWMRSEDEWVERTCTKRGKIDANLMRGAQDKIFRTRLCNHWDMSHGVFCPLRKKNRCVFAHGPIELRVKEGKIGRWGKLVDASGNNSNPFHSGGEDTYGAAKSIETVRKEEGKWKSPKKGKQRNSAGRKKQNLKK